VILGPAISTVRRIGCITLCFTLHGAALLSIGQSAQGAHGTIIAQFGLHFCKDGPLSVELGRALNQAQELRVEGDYDAGTPSATEVAAYIAKAEQFVAAVKGLV
jgi:uncharacterized protein (UPF0332 family)